VSESLQMEPCFRHLGQKFAQRPRRNGGGADERNVLRSCRC
jgi:hypothetical protein